MLKDKQDRIIESTENIYSVLRRLDDARGITKSFQNSLDRQVVVDQHIQERPCLQQEPQFRQGAGLQIA